MLGSLFKRRYQIKKAVDDFELDLEQGEILGLLGPNGAGKTTLMKMFTGIIVPSEGELRVLGERPSKRRPELLKELALVMGQKSQLWWDISAMETFRLLRDIYQVPRPLFLQRVERMSAVLGVQDLLDRQVRRLSLGERMKLELMASLIHRPKLIFLDEPTIGLDIVSQGNIRSFIKEIHKQENLTIVLTSHYMTDVEELCQRVVMVQEGRKTFDGPLSEFQEKSRDVKKITLTLKSTEGLQWDFLKKRPHFQIKNEQSLDVFLEKRELSRDLGLILKHLDVRDIDCHKTPIEDAMIDFLSHDQQRGQDVPGS